MKPLRILSTMIATLLIVFVVIPVLAHASLHRSDPAAGATVDHSPVEIFAWFSEPLSTGSSLSIFDAQFQKVDKGQTFIDASDATLMRAQVNPLEPGRYTVNWKANSVDGHESSGSYDFTVRESQNFILPAIIGLAVTIVLIVIYTIMRLISRRANR